MRNAKELQFITLESSVTLLSTWADGLLRSVYRTDGSKGNHTLNTLGLVTVKGLRRKSRQTVITPPVQLTLSLVVRSAGFEVVEYSGGAPVQPPFLSVSPGPDLLELQYPHLLIRVSHSLPSF